MEESFDLSSHYPIVWRRNDVGGLELVAVRTLLRDAEIPGIRRVGLDALPVLLQAYPFRHKNRLLGDFDIGLDRAAPASERNAGSYIYDHLGNMSAGAELKLKKLELFTRTFDWEKSLTSALVRHDMLEPVELPRDIQERFEVPEFFTAILEINHPILLSGIQEESWKLALSFLTAQRLSLFRMGQIIRRNEREIEIS